jgi:hypothetical protein
MQKVFQRRTAVSQSWKFYSVAINVKYGCLFPSQDQLAPWPKGVCLTPQELNQTAGVLD